MKESCNLEIHFDGDTDPFEKYFDRQFGKDVAKWNMDGTIGVIVTIPMNTADSPAIAKRIAQDVFNDLFSYEAEYLDVKLVQESVLSTSD